MWQTHLELFPSLVSKGVERKQNLTPNQILHSLSLSLHSNVLNIHSAAPKVAIRELDMFLPTSIHSLTLSMHETDLGSDK